MNARQLLIVGALLYCTAGKAQIQQGTTPQIGIATTATVGGVMLEEFRFKGVAGVILRGDVQANWGTLEKVVLPAGTPLVIIRDKRLKACQVRTNINWLNCVIDTNDTGFFNRVSFNEIAGAKDITPPVAYEKVPVQLGVDPRFGEGDNFKRQLIYTGSTVDTLTITYREFINDLARPAFTENLTVPLVKSFPQNIAVKNHKFH